MALTLRAAKGSALTHNEMDSNLSGLSDGSNWASTVTHTGVLKSGGVKVTGGNAPSGDSAGVELLYSGGIGILQAYQRGTGAAFKELQVLGNIIKFFGDGATEGGRFSAQNYLKIGGGGTYANATGTFHELVNTAGATSNVALVWNTAASGDNKFLEFGTEGSYTTRGSITYNRGGGVVAFNTSSDYRLKDLDGLFSGALEQIDGLKVHNGRMKGSLYYRPMFVAHEAQAVVPYSVTGQKDAVEDDRPAFQQMDHSVLVPLLVSGLQELRAQVRTLQAR